MLKNNKRVTLLLFGIALCLTGLIWERTGTASADTTAKRCGAVTAFTPAAFGPRGLRDVSHQPWP